MTEPDETTYTAALNANNLLLTRLTPESSFALVKRMDKMLRAEMRIPGSDADVCRRARQRLRDSISAAKIADAYSSKALETLSVWMLARIKSEAEGGT
jgi:hypothetical protein